LRQRFPAYRLDPDMVGVYQPDAGFLLPERCIVAHVAAAKRLGAEVHAREPAIEWAADDKGVVVVTERDRYRAGRLILSAGPWARRLVPALQDVAVPERQVMMWTEPLRPEHFRVGEFPVFNLEAPEGRFYGFPTYGLPGVKFGKYHHRRERVDDPDRMDRGCHPEDEETVRVGIRRYFPDADGPAIRMVTCLFTNSPDGHFLLDALPDSPRVVVAAGFSGHGFKFCSVVGEILADLALEGGTRWDIAMFRLGRFADWSPDLEPHDERTAR
jgi:sarcosine oxidase